MTTDDYEQKRLELQQSQHAALLEEGGDYKRHHDYIERLKGRDPGRGTELLKVLTVVRSLAPNPVSTSAISSVRLMYTKACTAKLKHLKERGLIGQQAPLPHGGTGNYESNWLALETATWPKKKAKK